MTVLSKLAGRFFIVDPYSCYELGHTWEPSCVVASASLIPPALKASLRVYGSLYVATACLGRLRSKRRIAPFRLLVNILRSSVFLTANVYLFLSFMCLQRQALGFFTFPTIGLTSGFFASSLAIQLEQRSRHPMLALYMVQLASEQLYRMMLHRDLLKPIPGGEAMIFGLGLAGFMYLLADGSLEKGFQTPLRLVFGLAEPSDDGNPNADKIGLINVARLPLLVQALVRKIRGLSSTASCEHTNSCASDIVESFIRNASYAYPAAQVAYALASFIRGSLKDSVTRALKLTAFFSSLPLLYKSTRCFLYRFIQKKYDSVSEKQRRFVAAVSGLISGLAMVAWPNPSVALWVLWKFAETIYMKGCDRNLVPRLPAWLVYGLATGFMLHAGVLEPHSLRGSYWGFLMRLTGGRFGMVYRQMIDTVHSTQSSVTFPFRPVLDPKFTTFNPDLVS